MGFWKTIKEELTKKVDFAMIPHKRSDGKTSYKIFISEHKPEIPFLGKLNPFFKYELAKEDRKKLENKGD